MCPALVLDLPDAGVGLGPAAADRLDGEPGCSPASGVEAIVPGGEGEKLQGFAEDVELELPVDVVSDDVGAA